MYLRTYVYFRSNYKSKTKPTRKKQKRFPYLDPFENASPPDQLCKRISELANLQAQTVRVEHSKKLLKHSIMTK